PVGNDVDTMWKNIVAGQSGIDFVTKVNKEDFPAKVAGEVKDFDPLKYIEKKEARRMDLFTQYAVTASKMAVEDAEITTDETNAERDGVWSGSGIGGMTTYEEQYNKSLTRGHRRVSPMFIPMMIADMAAGQFSIQIGANGTIACTITACAEGASLIGDAVGATQRSDGDYRIAGGTKAAITNMAVEGFSSMEGCSDNEDHTKASRPFDNNRNGR